MPRIYIPEIPETLVNELTTIDSTLEWMKRLEQAQKRLEEELALIKLTLRMVINPRFNQLNKEKMEREIEQGKFQ